MTQKTPRPVSKDVFFAILKTNHKINDPDYYEFLYACRMNDLATVKRLAGTLDVHRYGERIVMMCASHDNRDVLQYLVSEYELPVDYKEGKALLEAARANNLGMFIYLHKQGLDLRSLEDAALLEACEHVCIDIVRYILSHEWGAGIKEALDFSDWDRYELFFLLDWKFIMRFPERAMTIWNMLDEEQKNPSFAQYYQSTMAIAMLRAQQLKNRL